MTRTTARVSTTGRVALGGSAVLLAGTLANGLAYLVPMLGARLLPAADLGALATAQALVTIAAVAGTGLQMAIAVHRARHPHASTNSIIRRTAIVTGGLLTAAAPVVVTMLDLPLGVVAMLIATTLVIVLASGLLGELQGDQRFLRLAAGMAVLALGRYAGLAAALALGAGLVGALLAGLVGAVVVLPVLEMLARDRRAPVTAATPVAAEAGEEPSPLGLRQVVTAGSATLAMLVASYADLLLARQLLPPAESGAYSVGTVLTKGALWAPQVVTVLALPRMARRDGSSRTEALAVVATCGVLLVAGSALAGGLAFRLVGGPAYASLGRYAPVFAATGALYALAFLLINAQLAMGVRWPALPLWAGAGGLVTGAVLIAPHTFTGVMWSALAAAAATTLALALVAYFPRTARPAPRPDALSPPAGTALS
ncbi:lipopolysaccharide biosynthesis protein [Micromonospora sp. NPDC049366]|uniref:lipopolysaccharide biosynthesis protein n=1 Tax=Micromonospora sp. NPDC049366 TaxID=3364271 RepID=UPI003792D530